MKKIKVEKIEINDKYYPERLRNIKDAPKKLYVLGNKEILNNKGIAMVGSRNCTNEGLRNARFFSVNIAMADFTIISGMAKGIDSAAHLGAIEAKGKTIAVLGCGVDYIYPKENKEIYKKILESGGAIISEYEIGEKTAPDKFRKRNRIVSGLSMGVLVVEARYKSGTGITVKYAKSQKRDIFCIPTSIENKRGLGSNLFIKKGASLVTSPEQILEKYNIKSMKQISIEELESEANKDNLSVKEEYREIYQCLIENLSIDEISIKTKLNITDVYSKLFMMEIEGIIKREGNNYKVI